MSWLSGIVGKAEDLLNQVDQTAAVALQKNESSSRTGTSFISSNSMPQHSHISSVRNSYQTPNYGTTEYSKPYATPSNPTAKSSPAVLKSKWTKSSTIDKDDDRLLEYLNSNEVAFVPRKITPPPKSNPSVQTMKSQEEDTKVVPNSGNAEVSNSTEEHLADKSRSAEESIEISVYKEVETSPLVQTENTSNDNLNMESYTGNEDQEDSDSLVQEESKNIQQNYNEVMPRKENELLRNEIKLLNEEIENATRKNKDLESEMKRMQKKLEHWNSQVSGSDHLIRDLQERETDLSNALNAKDSQLAVLRVRLQEADQELQVKRSLVEQLRSENERLTQDQNSSLGIHNQTVESLKEKLRETDTALQREKAAYKSLQAENMERLSRLEDEQKKLVETLTSTQKALSEEKAQNKDLSSQIKLAAINLESLRQEFSDYKQKAQRILQSKEKVIASLKEAHTGSQEGENSENFTNVPVASVETELLQQECEILREELHKSTKHFENVQLEMQEMERLSQNDMENCREQIRVLEDQFKHEQQQRISLEQECSQQREELRFFHEDLARTKTTLQSRIHDRDSEIEKLRKQLTTKSLSSTSQSELESRLHSLTESLIQKQTVVEALSTEKNSLVLQLERLEQQLRDSNSSGSRRHNTVVGIGSSEHASSGERYRPGNGYFLSSPYDGPIARRMKRVYGIIDSFSIRSGVFLRRYPMARIFVIVYMILLHLWVTIVLLTYKPEVHGPHYNLERT